MWTNRLEHQNNSSMVLCFTVWIGKKRQFETCTYSSDYHKNTSKIIILVLSETTKNIINIINIKSFLHLSPSPQINIDEPLVKNTVSEQPYLTIGDILPAKWREMPSQAVYQNGALYLNENISPLRSQFLTSHQLNFCSHI